MWKSPDSQWTTVSLFFFGLPCGIKLIFSSYELKNGKLYTCKSVLKCPYLYF